MSLINQFRHQIRTYIYIPVYKGPFEYKKKETQMSNFPFGINRQALEREMEEIKRIREEKIKDQDVSPFHLVWRYKSFLILRRLGIHQKNSNIPAVIPNTPHYNALLWEVKHLIRLKPIKFPNGLPTEKDIGFIKVDMHTGEMSISSAYKIPSEDLEKADTPGIFSGKYLREYLKWASGMIGNSLPCHEVEHRDGNHIEEFDKRMKNYHKHQHKFYSPK